MKEAVAFSGIVFSAEAGGWRRCPWRIWQALDNARTRKEDPVERSPDPHEWNLATAKEEPKDVGTEEREIDQILADSFPASDAPPWTLGVTETGEGRPGKKGPTGSSVRRQSR
jgi:hypothetical protein